MAAMKEAGCLLLSTATGHANGAGQGFEWGSILGCGGTGDVNAGVYVGWFIAILLVVLFVGRAVSVALGMFGFVIDILLVVGLAELLVQAARAVLASTQYHVADSPHGDARDTGALQLYIRYGAYGISVCAYARHVISSFVHGMKRVGQ